MFAAPIIGWPLAPADATIAYGAHASKNAPSSPATYSAHGIGSAASNRTVIVALCGYRNGGGGIAPTLTIGGVSATLVASAVTAQFEAYLYALNVASGTTADIVATYSGGWFNLNCATWAAYGLSSITPTASASDLTAASTTMTASLTIPAGGVAVGIHGNNNAGGQTWTGLTESFDTTDVTSRQCTGAALATATLQSGLSISVTNTSGDGVLLVAAWDN